MDRKIGAPCAELNIEAAERDTKSSGQDKKKQRLNFKNERAPVVAVDPVGRDQLWPNPSVAKCRKNISENQSKTCF